MGNYIPQEKHLLKPQTQPEYDEIMIMSDVHSMAKLFIKDYLIIWHNPNLNEIEKKKYIPELQTISDVKTFTNWKEASAFIKETKTFCHVITSGKDGMSLTNEISNMPNVPSIYVFCRDIDLHSQWAKKNNKIVCVENDFKKLLSKINRNMMKWQRETSCLRVDFPAFAPIFDDTDKSETNYRHILLQKLIRFNNREQAKRDFLLLSKEIFKDFQNMEDFNRIYKEYDMRSILHWYTKESFLYKVTNNCLRIGTSDAFQYSRLIIKDLETAIKMQYEEKSKCYNGLCQMMR